MLYIIAGPNGAGKTTASYTLLPEVLNCREFVNADEIARGLSPFNPESVAFEAGRIMLQRIQQLARERKTFAFETTLTTLSYINLIKDCKDKGYHITLIFFWLNSPELAVQRVQLRVAKGGHSIPENVIRRRYDKGLKNFVNLFLPVCDEWMVADNSLTTPYIVASGNFNAAKTINHPQIWNKILSYGR